MDRTRDDNRNNTRNNIRSNITGQEKDYLKHYLNVVIATFISYLILCVTCAHIEVKGDQAMLMLIIEMSGISAIITATLDIMKGKWKNIFTKSNKRRHK